MRVRPRAVHAPLVLAVVFATSLLAPGAAAETAGGWRQVGGGRGHAGAPTGSTVFDSSNVADLRPAWTRTLEGPSDVSVVGERVYLVNLTTDRSFGLRLVALDARTGSNVWRSSLLPVGQPAQPVVVGGRVFVAIQLDAFHARLFVFSVGPCAGHPCDPLWSASWQIFEDDAGNPIGDEQITVAGGYVYAQSSLALLAFDARGCGAFTCDPVWSAPYPDNDVKVGPPAVGHGTVFVTIWINAPHRTGVQLRAFDAHGCGSSTCPFLWKAWGSATTPLVTRSIVIGRNQPELTAFDAGGCGASHCPSLWSASTQVSFASDGAIGDESVLMASGELSAFPLAGCAAAIDCPPSWTSDFVAAHDVSITNDVAFVFTTLGLQVYPVNGCGEAVCSPIVTIDVDSDSQAAIAPEVIVTRRFTTLTGLRLPN